MNEDAKDEGEAGNSANNSEGDADSHRQPETPKYEKTNNKPKADEKPRLLPELSLLGPDHTPITPPQEQSMPQEQPPPPEQISTTPEAEPSTITYQPEQIPTISSGQTPTNQSEQQATTPQPEPTSAACQPEQAPATVWEEHAIETQTPTYQTTAKPIKKKTNNIVAAAAVLLAGIIIIIGLTLPNNPHTTISPVTTQTTSPTTQTTFSTATTQTTNPPLQCFTAKDFLGERFNISAWSVACDPEEINQIYARGRGGDA
jgi:hypothetical protein